MLFRGFKFLHDLPPGSSGVWGSLNIPRRHSVYRGYNPIQSGIVETIRRATYVFRHSAELGWLCTVDNSYGTDLLDSELPSG
ncbi:hypothetical protein TUM17576_05130 [Enterobacter hormaechei]|nr:hypothetical protein TUM17576_05130 [Enterobacter hormaechei]